MELPHRPLLATCDASVYWPRYALGPWGTTSDFSAFADRFNLGIDIPLPPRFEWLTYSFPTVLIQTWILAIAICCLSMVIQVLNLGGCRTKRRYNCSDAATVAQGRPHRKHAAAAGASSGHHSGRNARLIMFSRRRIPAQRGVRCSKSIAEATSLPRAGTAVAYPSSTCAV